MNSNWVERLDNEAHDFLRYLDANPLVGRVIGGDASRDQYVRFLRATYHYVCWSGVLLARTAEGLARTGRSPALQRLLALKSAEEDPHYRWVLADLARCGEDVARVRAEPRPRAVTAYLEFGLALAEVGSPAYLGAAYVLEFISMHRARVAADRLRARGAIAGIGEALSFLEGHGDADQDHVTTLRVHLAAIDQPGDRVAIEAAAAVTRALYPCFFALPPSNVAAVTDLAAAACG